MFWAAYSKNVPESVRSDYYLMKEALLDSLGLTVDHFRTEFLVIEPKVWRDMAEIFLLNKSSVRMPVNA